MKRYEFQWGHPVENVDGEWIRYEDHCEAMTRIAGEVERCQCCGYLVTESEHRGCLRAAAPSANGQQAEPVANHSRVCLSGAQLLEALDFIAPDRDTDREQLESDVTIQYGGGHDGTGYYCWVSDYPEEGAILLDGEGASSILAAPAPKSHLQQWSEVINQLPVSREEQPTPSAPPAALTETAGITKAEVLRVGVEVGLIDRVMDDGDYFTFADHEVMTPRLIKLIEAFRAAPAPSGPPAYKDSTPHLRVGDSSFESWYEQKCASGWSGQKQLARDAYAAGMGDPLVMARAIASPVALLAASPADQVEDARDALMLELLESYEAIFRSAYCQLDADDDLIRRVRAAMSASKEGEQNG